MKKRSEILRQAAQVIRDQGWTQNNFGTRGGPVCAWGALNVAAGEPIPTYSTPEAIAAMEFVEHWILRDHLPKFNDADGRTADEVINLLARAAALAERHEATTDEEASS